MNAGKGDALVITARVWPGLVNAQWYDSAMAAYYEVRFLPAGAVRQAAGSERNFYALEDGSRVNVRTTPVWCRHCGDFRDGEQIETLEGLDREIRQLSDPSTPVF